MLRALAGDTPQNVRARIDFANWYLDQQAAGKEFAWFDEVPFNLSMRVAYGRSQVGVRAEDFIDDLAAARDAVGLPNDTIVILDNVAFHHSANVIEMLELRGFPYKFLPPYSPYFMAIECMFAEWKTYVKRGLANTRALTRVELELRINSFVLSPHHAMNYVTHAGRNIEFLRS